MKKQTNQVLVLSQKKIENTFKDVVEVNKQYFNYLSEIGSKMVNDDSQQKIEVKYPDINKSFYSDVELDDKLMQQLICQHLQREGLNESLKVYS